MLKSFIVIASLAASTAAVAAPGHLTDGQYLAAARCRALIASPALGKGDTTAIDAVLRRQAAGRMSFVAEKADQVQLDAARAVGHADADAKAKLMAERDGACRVYAGASSGAAGGPSTGAN